LVSKKKWPFALGTALSVALSLFCLMLLGLLVNTVLPLLGITLPLSTIPLLITFDSLIVVLFVLNIALKKEFALEIPEFNKKSGFLLFLLFLIPIFSIFGSIILNNNGSNFLS